MSTASSLDRFLEPVTDVLTPEVASAFVELRADPMLQAEADPMLQAEIDDLRRKANEGTLSEMEDAEYKDLVEAVDVVSIIQSKARQFLSKHPA